MTSSKPNGTFPKIPKFFPNQVLTFLLKARLLKTYFENVTLNKEIVY